MAIFNSYVSLPEGSWSKVIMFLGDASHCFQALKLMTMHDNSNVQQSALG